MIENGSGKRNTGKEVVTIQVYRRDDGQYDIRHIRHDGKPWDGFWQEHEMGEEDFQALMSIFPPPDVPESCRKCDFFWGVFDHPPYMCRLDIHKGILRTFDGKTEPEEMTIQSIESEKWLTETPDWCWLKKG